MLLDRPSSSVEHDGEPSHHAAAQHVAKIFDVWNRPLLDVTFQHSRWQHMAGVVECTPVGEGIIGIGNGKVIAMSGGAEIDHAATIVADLKQQARMGLAHS